MILIFLSFLLSLGPLESVYTEPYVDVPPRCTLYVNPIYPPPARGDSGLVILHILVDKEGVPESTKVFFFTDSIFRGPAEEAAKFFRFSAARLNNRNVPCWTFVSIPFIPSEFPEISFTQPKGSGTKLVVLRVKRDGTVEFFADDWRPLNLDTIFIKELNLRDVKTGESYLLKVPESHILTENQDP